MKRTWGALFGAFVALAALVTLLAVVPPFL
jgi:hypothetical protein